MQPHNNVSKDSEEPETTQDLPFEIKESLRPIVQRMALVDDVTGPLCELTKSSEYVRAMAERLSEPIGQALRRGGSKVGQASLEHICARSAAEVFAIRSLNEQRLNQKITMEFVRTLSLYKLYANYLEQTPEIVQEGFQIAIEAAALSQKRGR